MMSHHVSLLYHIVFRTKRSRKTIVQEHEKELYAYILGIVRNKGCWLYRIGGMPDHIHMLMTMPPTIALSTLMKVVKAESSKWLKESDLFPDFDGWGSGYAAFSYAMRDKEMIYHYIANQKEHHQTKTFNEEYRAFLIENGINPDEDKFLMDDDAT